jgi:hypothetical protein
MMNLSKRSPLEESCPAQRYAFRCRNGSMPGRRTRGARRRCVVPGGVRFDSRAHPGGRHDSDAIRAAAAFLAPLWADVAHHGDRLTAIHVVQGEQIVQSGAFAHRDGMRIAGRVVDAPQPEVREDALGGPRRLQGLPARELQDPIRAGAEAEGLGPGADVTGSHRRGLVGERPTAAPRKRDLPGGFPSGKQAGASKGAGDAGKCIFGLPV